jgi:hypothetical protein
MIVMIASFVAMSATLADKTRADESNQAIEVKFSQSVQVPGQVLPAGTYWFVMADTGDLQTVQILSDDRLKSFGYFLGTRKEVARYIRSVCR